ncbi:MAG: gliding motility-associated C-terminal domain-containing protein, partial [Bacteroidota bacterium]
SCSDCLNPTLTPSDNEVYTLSVTGTSGCSDVASTQIVVDQSVKYFIPNVFSPNEDGVNDVFSVFGDDLLERVISMEIYDRWGGQVYQASNLPVNDATAGWDGRYRGELAQAGIYVYILRLQTKVGEVISTSGDVMLLR